MDETGQDKGKPVAHTDQVNDREKETRNAGEALGNKHDKLLQQKLTTYNNAQ